MRQIFYRNPYNLEIQYLNGNTPIDLSGYTITFIIKELFDNSPNDSGALLKKSVVIPNDTGTKYIFSLSSTETKIKVGKYKSEIQLSNTVGLETTYLTCEQDELVIKETLIKE